MIYVEQFFKIIEDHLFGVFITCLIVGAFLDWLIEYRKAKNK